MKRWLIVAAVALLGVCVVGWTKHEWITDAINFNSRQRNIAQAIAAASPDQLREFLDQPDAELRRVAAVRLARINDASGRAALVASLYPQTVFATGTGTFQVRIKPGATLKAGQVIANIGGQPVRSPITGQLLRFYEPQPGGYQFGHRVAEIAPAESGVKEAIDAIGLVGKQSDAEELESLARAFPKYSVETNAACQKIRTRRQQAGFGRQ